MDSDLATRLVERFEQGRLTRRQLIAQLIGLGAAMAAANNITAMAEEAGQGVTGVAEPTFKATGLHHIALDVTDVARSNEFYIKHLGLRVIRGDDNASFLGAERDFFLTLFRAERPGLNHYSHAIDNYDADATMERLAGAGLRPRREGNRVYFPDPDGLTVQVSGR